MATNNLKEKMAQLVSKEPSKWVEEAKWRSENRTWLKRSQAIAIRILARIDELNITQKELAESMIVSPQQVNKIVKGKENLTLDTISKFEKALGIKLIEIPDTIVCYNYDDVPEETISFKSISALESDISSPINYPDIQENKPSSINMVYDSEKNKYSYTKEAA